jgi:hypothetical protein|tara:strand:- start:3424 stop:3708 length:285 start_codon:yes stop_codon:yes gene_type:complete
MAIIGYVDNIPVFETPIEALQYGNTNGLVGYHTHNINGVVGYMAGPTHGQAASGSQGSMTSNFISTGSSSTPEGSSSSGSQGAPSFGGGEKGGY